MASVTTRAGDYCYPCRSTPSRLGRDADLRDETRPKIVIDTDKSSKVNGI